MGGWQGEQEAAEGPGASARDKGTPGKSGKTQQPSSPESCSLFSQHLTQPTIQVNHQKVKTMNHYAPTCLVVGKGSLPKPNHQTRDRLNTPVTCPPV